MPDQEKPRATKQSGMGSRATFRNVSRKTPVLGSGLTPEEAQLVYSLTAARIKNYIDTLPPGRQSALNFSFDINPYAHVVGSPVSINANGRNIGLVYGGFPELSRAANEAYRSAFRDVWMSRPMHDFDPIEEYLRATVDILKTAATEPIPGGERAREFVAERGKAAASAVGRGARAVATTAAERGQAIAEVLAESLMRRLHAEGSKASPRAQEAERFAGRR